ncbi:MAG: triose-phosphate isomerase [Paenibacillaceae bacterium]|nr:triose-phosphate isomerase [Paenibacillaceae bacterium]
MNTLVCANWKMNQTVQTMEQWCTDYSHAQSTHRSDVEVVVCAPFVLLPALVARAGGMHVRIAAQNVSERAHGAFTGEVSAEMLQSIGVNTAIVGHSERRTLFGETDDDVAAKVVRLLALGMTPICCVGETLDAYRAGKTVDVITQQMHAVIKKMNDAALTDAHTVARLVIAYEPVWAIGTGLRASAQEAQEAIFVIERMIAEAFGDASRVRKLYGGSVDAQTFGAYLDQPSIQGALVGGASLDSGHFASLVRIAQEKHGARI